MTEQAKGYPVILGGDHAEFELEHANTPLKERPDWPLPSFDARDWAVAFCKIAKTDGLEIDEAWMQTWFSNALMRGFDEQAGRINVISKERDNLRTSMGEIAAYRMPATDAECRMMLHIAIELAKETLRAAVAAVEAAER